MESVTFVSVDAQRNTFLSNGTVPLIKIKAAGFEDGAYPCVAVAHRLICFTLKKPTEVRILDRIGAQKVDTVLPFAVSQLITLSDVSFAAAGESSVAIVTAEMHADGGMTAGTPHVVQLDDTVRAIAAGPNGTVVAALASGVVAVVNGGAPAGGAAAESAVKTKFSVGGSKAPPKAAVIAVHKDLCQAIVPGKGTALDVVSLNSEKSLLSKAWVPHGEDVPTFAHLFSQHRGATTAAAASASSAGGGTRFVLTAANGNRELRFWSVDAQQAFTLIQQVLIVEENAADAPAADRILTVSHDEDYLLLASRDRASVVVVELDRNTVKATRATDWNTGTPSLFCAPTVRKRQEGKSLTIELAAVVRSSDMISIVTFDTARLVGASNLQGPSSTPAAVPVATAVAGSSAVVAAAAAAAVPVAPAPGSGGAVVSAIPATATAPTGSGITRPSQHGQAAASGSASSITKWFGQLGDALAASPLSTPQLPTSVSSTISGSKVSTGVDAQYVTGQALAALRTQTTSFREALSAIDAQIFQLQKQAGIVMKVLQEARSKDDAQLTGKEFALRNKHRLAQSGGAAGASNNNTNVQATAAIGGQVTMTQQQHELILSLQEFVSSIPASVREASGDTCRRLMATTLPGAISKAMAAADNVDTDTALPSLSVSEAMQSFSIAVDKVHQSQNNLLKQERNTVESLAARLMQGSDRVTKTVAANKTFLSTLKSELSGLKGDLREAVEAVRSAKASSVAASPPPTVEQVLQQANALAASGKWTEALTKVESTGDLSALMHFLESDLVRDQAAVLVQPSTIPVTLMAHVCLRLATDLKENLGNAPFRVKWVHDFLVEWDETLAELKESQPQAFASVRDLLEQVGEYLGQVDTRKDVDRSTKNQLTLSKKLILALL